MPSAPTRSAQECDMLRLPAMANGGTWILYADHADPEIAYVLPDVPRVRRAPDGTALLSLLKLRDIAGATGGLLAVQTDLSLTADEQAAAVDAYRSATGSSARLADPLWLSGTASLTVPGPQVTSMDAQPALTGTAAATFECGVTQDAAVVLAAGLGRGRACCRSVTGCGHSRCCRRARCTSSCGWVRWPRRGIGSGSPRRRSAATRWCRPGRPGSTSTTTRAASTTACAISSWPGAGTGSTR